MAGLQSHGPRVAALSYAVSAIGKSAQRWCWRLLPAAGVHAAPRLVRLVRTHLQQQQMLCALLLKASQGSSHPHGEGERWRHAAGHSRLLSCAAAGARADSAATGGTDDMSYLLEQKVAIHRLCCYLCYICMLKLQERIVLGLGCFLTARQPHSLQLAKLREKTCRWQHQAMVGQPYAKVDQKQAAVLLNRQQRSSLCPVPQLPSPPSQLLLLLLLPRRCLDAVTALWLLGVLYTAVEGSRTAEEGSGNTCHCFRDTRLASA